MANPATSRSKTAIGAVISVVMGILVVAAVGTTLHAHSNLDAPTGYAKVNGTIVGPDGKTYPHAFINDNVFADAADSKIHGSSGGHAGWPSYGPYINLVLPAHTYVTMTMHVYDGGETMNTPYFASVVGTVGGTINIDGKDVSSLPHDGVQHTFTLHGLPTSSQDPLFVNVPLPKTPEGEQDEPGAPLPKGYTVTFSFITAGKGNYIWNCEYPCGDGTYRKFGGVMSAYGYMSGKVTVA